MSLNSTIINALKPFAPVSFHNYTGTATTYITFFTYHQGTNLTADDEEKSTRFNVQIDVFSKGNLETLVENVKDALKPYGFRRITEVEMFEVNTKTYRKMLNFSVAIDTDEMI